MNRAAFPPLYVLTIQRMADHLRAELRRAPEPAPRFCLPPREIMVVAAIGDVAPRICRNARALELVEHFQRIGREVQPHGDPTLNMLGHVLDLCRVPTESISLADLGVRSLFHVSSDPRSN